MKPLASAPNPRLGGWVRRFVTTLIVMGEIVIASPVSAANAELIMGVFPRRSPSEMMDMFNPLAQHLSRELGRPVKLETTPDFKSFWEAVAAGRFHLVHYNQYHYVRSHKQYGYHVIAKNEEAHRSTLAGALVVRKDSELKSLQDLRGKKIIFGGDKQALVSYILPTYLLRQAGLKQGDYNEDFAQNPSNVALTVFFHQADAGGIGDFVFETKFVSDKVDVAQMRYLVTGEQVAHLPWAVRADVPMVERLRIQQILLRVKDAPNGENILKSAALTQLRIAEDSEYNSVRRIIKTVTGEKY